MVGLETGGGGGASLGEGSFAPSFMASSIISSLWVRFLETSLDFTAGENVLLLGIFFFMNTPGVVLKQKFFQVFITFYSRMSETAGSPFSDIIRLRITTPDPLATPWNYQIVQQLLDTSDVFERKFTHCMTKSGRLRVMYNSLLRFLMVIFAAISGSIYFLRDSYWWVVILISIVGTLIVLFMKGYDFLKKSRHYRFTAYKYLEAKYSILQEINKPIEQRASSPVELLIRLKENMQRAENDLEANKIDDPECIETIKFDFRP